MEFTLLIWRYRSLVNQSFKTSCLFPRIFTNLDLTITSPLGHYQRPVSILSVQRLRLGRCPSIREDSLYDRCREMMKLCGESREDSVTDKSLDKQLFRTYLAFNLWLGLCQRDGGEQGLRSCWYIESDDFDASMVFAWLAKTGSGYKWSLHNAETSPTPNFRNFLQNTNLFAM